jgi:hypothetical protein
VDYEVYSAYLGSFSFYKNVPSAESIIITDSTTMQPDDIHTKTPWAWVLANMGDRCRFLKDTMSCRKAHEAGWDSLFENVKHASEGKQEFLAPIKFKVRYPVQLLSQFRKEESKQTHDDSLSYYIFGLSKISYNINKTKALFFGSFICGGTCGRGELIMMEKAGKNWQLVDKFRFWIA